MSSAIKSVGNALGFGGSATPSYQSANRKYYDISGTTKPFEDALRKMFESQAATSQAASPFATQALIQMGQAATGQGPSIAEAQLKAAQDRAVAQNAAMLSGARGGSPALNQRLISQQLGSNQRDLAQEAAAARLNERNQFLQNAMASDAALQQGAGNALQTALMPTLSMQEYERQRVAAANAQSQADAQANAARRGALFGGIGAALGSKFGGSGGGDLVKTAASLGPLLALSDKTQKKEIKTASKKHILEFLDAIHPKTYKYKNPNLAGAAHGKRTGVIAQDLEKSVMGKELVKNMPEGKHIDVPQSIGALFAATADMHKRIKKIEKKKKV